MEKSFIHRDAEREPREKRITEILEALEEAVQKFSSSATSYLCDSGAYAGGVAVI